MTGHIQLGCQQRAWLVKQRERERESRGEETEGKQRQERAGEGEEEDLQLWAKVQMAVSWVLSKKSRHGLLQKVAPSDPSVACGQPSITWHRVMMGSVDAHVRSEHP